MDSLTVAQSLFLRSGATFKGEVVLVGAKVGGDLDLSGATFHQNVDASNAVIERELRLGTSLHLVPVGANSLAHPSQYVGRRSSGQARQAAGRHAPGRLAGGQHLQLDGFTYKRLGGLGGEKRAAK